jgi:hypothetical protein
MGYRVGRATSAAVDGHDRHQKDDIESGIGNGLHF